MASPSVAIIIPTRNRPEMLKRCLSRVVPYVIAHPECSIVVSDDGDAAETRQLLAGQLDMVRLVQGPRRGPAANRNCGTAHSTGELLIFLDDDCIPDENLIAAYRNAAVKNPDTGVFEGRIGVEGKVSGFADAVPANETGGYLWSCNFAIRRELFARINGFDERFLFAAMEDVDFHLRVKNHSKVLFLPDARVLHEVDRRPGWRGVKHHALSLLLFLHIHGLKQTQRGPVYFLRGAGRSLVYGGLEHLRVGALRNARQLAFLIWVNLELAVITALWKFHASLAKWFFPPCCPGCQAIHANLQEK
jgi:GT2 family glycosyltransferase